MSSASTDGKQAEVSEEKQQQANELKSQGNKAFAGFRYAEAITFYTQAIEANPRNAVFFSNRAICHLRMENFGYALTDAATAIEIDPTYFKAYYRRGAALMSMGRYSKALKDFKQVCKLTKSKEAKRKYRACKDHIHEEAFMKAIASDPPNWRSMEVTDDYKGPRLEGKMSLDFIQELIEFYKGSINNRLHKRYVYKIVEHATAILRRLPTLVDVPIPTGTELTICGDVHGQMYDMLNIFENNGFPSPDNPYLFNGDFVDRGSWSLEIILIFFSLKILYPDSFHMNRGNHESRNMNNIYGFKGELVKKVDNGCFEPFSTAFNWLPLACLVNRQILVVHGGLFSTDGVTLSDIRGISRNQQPPDSGLMCELMWSDPQVANGRAPSKRGVGLSFGPDVSARFLDANNLTHLIRSHEVKENGYEKMHNGRVITVFSAPNYCDQVGNKGAFIRVNADNELRFTTFRHVPHPALRPMAYASPMFAQ